MPEAGTSSVKTWLLLYTDAKLDILHLHFNIVSPTVQHVRDTIGKLATVDIPWVDHCNGSDSTARFNVNVARGQPSWSSSVYFDGFDYPASLALDGNTNTNMSLGICMSTDSFVETYHSWMAVDLGRPSDVRGVVLWNRDGGLSKNIFVRIFTHM
jgi:hypothetical protein